MIGQPRFIKCGEVYYNLTAITVIDASRNLIWFLGESDGVDVGRETIETILKEVKK